MADNVSKTILKVYEYPDPILKQACLPVENFDGDLKSFVDDLVHTMNSHKYCVGLAAPQVGELKRIVAIDISRARKPQDGNGLLVLINPEIKEASKYKTVREGCLSIPELTANVKRAMKITIEYKDVNGETKTVQAKNFEAHAIQHEMDHLQGILFLDRITNPATEIFRRKKI